MRFRRRERQSRAQRIRQYVWPKSGWWRATQYIWRRVWRLADSPHAIAIGFAAGAFASLTPFWTMHFVIAALLAWALGGNILASAFGTIVGNPITFPFIVPAIYETGKFVLGQGGEMQEFDLWDAILAWDFAAIWPTWKPMMVGGFIIGPIVGVIFYFLVRSAVEAYQARRRARFAVGADVPDKPARTTRKDRSAG